MLIEAPSGLEGGEDVARASMVVDSPCPEGVDDPSRRVDDERGGHRDLATWRPEQEAVVPGGTSPVARADRVEDRDREAA
jgi:hypothetical protein